MGLFFAEVITLEVLDEGSGAATPSSVSMPTTSKPSKKRKRSDQAEMDVGVCKKNVHTFSNLFYIVSGKRLQHALPQYSNHSRNQRGNPGSKYRATK